MSIILKALEKAQEKNKQPPALSSPGLDKKTLTNNSSARAGALSKFKLSYQRPVSILLIFFGAVIVLLFLNKRPAKDEPVVPIQNDFAASDPAPVLQGPSFSRLNPVENPPRTALSSAKASSPPLENIFPEAWPQLDITGVVWDAKKPMVLINGKWLKQGDKILGNRIIYIGTEQIIFLYRGEEFAVSVEQ